VKWLSGTTNEKNWTYGGAQCNFFATLSSGLFSLTFLGGKIVEEQALLPRSFIASFFHPLQLFLKGVFV
jgi:hypothetical protein